MTPAAWLLVLLLFRFLSNNGTLGMRTIVPLHQERKLCGSLPVQCYAFGVGSVLPAFSENCSFNFLRMVTESADSSEEYMVQQNNTFYKRSTKWIVVVDDEEAIRTAVAQFLFEQGYRVTACPDADTAMKVLLNTRLDDSGGNFAVPDAIVSDIRMPGRDGLEMLADIRSNSRIVGVPVVLLTAKGQTKDRIAGYRAGTDAYLPKPFNPDELLTILDTLIERHEILSGANVEVGDLQREMDEIKHLLLKKGGGGVGSGWVKRTNVFLTPDERKALVLLAEGLTNKEIANEVALSQRRVEQLLTSMFRKTNVSNRTELVRWAISTGNVDI